ncbi:MAG: saccharopine dehydrogenase NADP-binding domain-containing protein [Chitinophagaceae bacterium]|nr:saccharopine dehydrogenase NADP-binding domain-containing protein [Chitinophagaceae bacterium]
MQIAVLGAGMVGRAIALDLAKDFAVTSFDLNPVNLQELRKKNPAVKTVIANLGDYNQYPEWLEGFGLVILAVPGFMGFRALESVILCGKDVVDISFFPEDVLQLDKLAREKNVTVIADCGVAPGMSNLILGHHHAAMTVNAFECYVGGLPKERKPPFQYKAPFSPVDVIQEYIRPARLVENGNVVTKPALSEREMLFFDKAGELEAFNTDGLRSLIYTMKDIPEMKEKTLRYPGHIDLIIALQQAGFFDTTPIRFNQTEISPLDFTSKLLFKEWKLDPGEIEFTVMKVIVKGEKKTITWDLYDEYDPLSKTSSMARTTGYTCTAAAHLITEGLFTKKGVFPPELIGPDKKCFDYIINYLKKRKVNWERTDT